MQRRIRLIVAVVALSALTSVAFAQWGRRFAPIPDQPLAGEQKEWTFARLAYDGGGYRRGSRYATDYPRAEYHFSQAVERLTRIDVHPDGHVLSPNTDDLFDYPWLYAVEVGSWGFDDFRLRECASICCVAASSWSTTFTARTSGNLHARHAHDLSRSAGRRCPGKRPRLLAAV